MRNSLKEAFDVDPDDNARYRRFISSLMMNLSLLVSNDKSSEMFDQDFDTFFTMVVRSINSCGEMMELLEQHGIEYRPKWKNEDDEGKD